MSDYRIKRVYEILRTNRWKCTPMDTWLLVDSHVANILDFEKGWRRKQYHLSEVEKIEDLYRKRKSEIGQKKKNKETCDGWHHDEPW